MDDLIRFLRHMGYGRDEIITDEDTTHERGRSCGRTFRQVMRALTKLSEKPDSMSAYIGPTAPAVGCAFDMAVDVSFRCVGGFKANRTLGCITFPNGSRLHFMTWDHLRDRAGFGARFETIILDT